MHLDEEKLQRVLDGELRPEETWALQSHLSECALCRRHLQEAEEEEKKIFTLLASLDHPLPSPPVDAVRSRAQLQPHRWGRWAAGVLLALGVTSAAYAAPGSPLPALLHRITHWTQSSSQPQTEAPREASPVGFPSGIAVLPGTSLSIQFSSLQERGRVTVELTDRAEVVVQALEGSPGFTADPDRLLIDNDGSVSDFQIEIPRDAPRIDILVEGELRFSKVGSRVTATTPPDAEGRFLIPLEPPRS